MLLITYGDRMSPAGILHHTETDMGGQHELSTAFPKAQLMDASSTHTTGEYTEIQTGGTGSQSRPTFCQNYLTVRTSKPYLFKFTVKALLIHFFCCGYPPCLSAYCLLFYFDCEEYKIVCCFVVNMYYYCHNSPMIEALMFPWRCFKCDILQIVYQLCWLLHIPLKHT